ncbi:MAG: restriction endonuclease subunit S [Nitrosomonas sp.]|uniref:restriction endonuclease subunit S n=1 Tax=Nitrosomonas sp. TaxID=42353 RepID=UPI001D279EAF|nr:restriction endonuclease subunit S [Nitrosomonas sp.]MBX9894245.1 restriction endonuclease subunit S [Nitrosomonas sp.]
MGTQTHVIPSWWEAASLSDVISKLVDGSHNPPVKQGMGFPMLSAVNINDNKIIFSDYRLISEDAFLLEDRRTRIAPGDVLLTIVGAIGRTAVVPEAISKFTLQRSVAVITPKLIAPKFLMYQFESPRIARYFKNNARGTAQKGVYLKTLGSTEIWIPPLSEQHRIVAKIEELFSELDKGIENLKTAQAQLKVYRQALLKHAFEGKLTAQWRAERHAKQSVAPAKAGAQPLNDMDSRLRGNDEMGGGNDEPLETADTLLKRIQQERAQRYQQQLADWEASGKQGSKPKAPKSLPPLTTEEMAELPELPEGWVYSYLADLGDLGRGKSKHRPRNDPRLFGGIYPFIQTGEVKSANRIIRQYSQTYSDFGLQQSKLWPTGTLCITIAANIAETAFLGFDSCFPDSVVGFSAFKKTIIPEYVDFFIQAARMRIEAYAPATAQKNINLETLENLVVPYCCLEEQRQILDILEERFSVIDQLDQTITTALQQAEALRESILKKAFSGQLVPQDPNDEPASELLARIRVEKVA